MDIISFSKHILDHRIDRRKEHSVETIVYIAMAAVICGAESWGEIEAFGICKKDFFARQIPSFNGIPSHDTFNRFFSSIDPAYFEREFRFWVRELCGKYEGVVAIDGKTIRGASRGDDKTPLEADRKSRFKLHMVSAWAADNGISLGQVRVNEKSNEITAIPELIKALDLVNCIITIDAMGCQKTIAKAIIEAKADYVLCVKKNQKNLLKTIEEQFNQADQIDVTTPYYAKRYSVYTSSEKGHGRQEERLCIAYNNGLIGKTFPEWEGIQTIARIASRRKETGEGEFSTEVRYYISSLPLDAKLIAESVRTHWSIENNLHWQLDVTFREDNTRKTNNAAQNVSVMCKMALSLLKKDTKKASMVAKRKIAGWDEEYLARHLKTENF